MTHSRKPAAPRPIRYPRSLSLLLTEEMYAAIAAEAVEETAQTGVKVSKAVVGRRYLEIGRGLADAAESAEG